VEGFAVAQAGVVALGHCVVVDGDALDAQLEGGFLALLVLALVVLSKFGVDY